MNRHLLGKNLDVFPQSSKIFLQTLMIILKIDITLKINIKIVLKKDIILGHVAFQLLPKSTFSLKFSLL